MKTKVRQSNIELLRIIAMFCIMCCHFKAHGLRFEESDYSFMNAFLSAFGNWTGNISVYIFMLISGWFLSSADFSWRKFFNIYIPYFFYSAIFGLYLYIFKCDIYPQGDPKIMDFNHLIACFLPFLTNQNWYAGAYLVFFLFVPYLNKLLEHTEKESLFKLCLIFIVLGGICQSLPVQKSFNPDYLFYFVSFYFIANYIKRYRPSIFQSNIKNGCISVGCILLMTLGSLLIYFLSKKIRFIDNHFEFFFRMPTCNFIKIISSIFIFCFFCNLNIPYIKLINILGGCTYGVYLLHNNRTFKHYMWFNIFKSQEHINDKFLPIYICCCVIILFCNCVFIELVRQRLFKSIELIFRNLVNMKYIKYKKENTADN